LILPFLLSVFHTLYSLFCKEVGIIACTATADDKVTSDIKMHLKLNQDNLYFCKGDLNRPNFFFAVKRRDKDTTKEIADFLCEHKDEDGIIYVLTRKDAEDLCGRFYW
jgi:ATP-dependent DNA helicase RecQ